MGDWLGDEEHRARLLVLIPALGLIGGFLGRLFGLFKQSSGGGQRASGSSVNVGGNVAGDVMHGGQRAAGGAAAVGGDVGRDLNIGYTPEQHEAALQMRLNELRADLDAKHAAMAEAGAARQELLRRDLDQIRQEKAEVERRLDDLDASYREAVAKIGELEALLEREGSTIGGDRLAKARAALEKGDFSKADEIFAEIEARDQPAVQSTARAAYGRGEIAEEQVRWADAAEHYARAAGLEPTFEVLEKAAQYAWRSGQFSEVEHFVRKMLTIARTANSLDEGGLALNSLALLLQEQGSLDAAEPHYRKALEIAEKTIGTEHPDYATRLNNLAELLRATGRHDEAESLYRQALGIDKRTIGTAHPGYAVDLNNLANLLRDTGRHDEAEPLYRQALEIFRAALGPDHPNTKTVEENYAAFLRERDAGAAD